MWAEGPRIPRPEELPGVPVGQSAENLLRPLPGIEHAVPWFLPCSNEHHPVTFWGSGNAHSVEFFLPSDAALRILTRTGPLIVRVQRKDGSFLDDCGCLDGKAVRRGVLAIPHSGTYSLMVQAEAGHDWAITIVCLSPCQL